MLFKLLDYNVSVSKAALLTMLVLSSSPAEGRQEWTCKKNGLTRKLVIAADPYGTLPCEIVYKKPTEGVPDTVIAKASRDFAFCESKAEEVALKLQNGDWECEREDS